MASFQNPLNRRLDETAFYLLFVEERARLGRRSADAISRSNRDVAKKPFVGRGTRRRATRDLFEPPELATPALPSGPAIPRLQPKVTCRYRSNIRSSGRKEGAVASWRISKKVPVIFDEGSGIERGLDAAYCDLRFLGGRAGRKLA